MLHYIVYFCSFKQRIDDDVVFSTGDYFGVTFEQETGTITREVNANGRLMFSEIYGNLPNTGDEIVIIQENYLNMMSMAAIVDDGQGNYQLKLS